MAQLAERSLPTPEVRSSNPDIGNISNINCQLLSRKDENKEKEAGNGPFKKRLDYFNLGVELVKNQKHLETIIENQPIIRTKLAFFLLPLQRRKRNFQLATAATGHNLAVGTSQKHILCQLYSKILDRKFKCNLE